jgi:hypothetical protein
MTLTPTEQLTQLVTNGYFLTDVTELLPSVDIDHCEFHQRPSGIADPDPNDPIFSRLEILQNTVGEKIITPLFGSYQAGTARIWNQTDEASTKWHNDYVEGYNLFVLIYFDILTPGLGGKIHIRNPQGEVFTHLPTRGDCIFVNLKQGFDHRVDHTRPRTATRRVANLRYNVPLLG